MYQFGEVVLVEVSFAEDHTMVKTRPAIVLQQDGEQVQLIWATSKGAEQCTAAWEFCVQDPSEMAAMGHTKRARYTFRRGGVIVVRADSIKDKIGICPTSVIGRLVKAARNA